MVVDGKAEDDAGFSDSMCSRVGLAVRKLEDVERLKGLDGKFALFSFRMGCCGGQTLAVPVFLESVPLWI